MPGAVLWQAESWRVPTALSAWLPAVCVAGPTRTPLVGAHLRSMSFAISIATTAGRYT